MFILLLSGLSNAVHSTEIGIQSTMAEQLNVSRPNLLAGYWPFENLYSP